MLTWKISPDSSELRSKICKSLSNCSTVMCSLMQNCSTMAPLSSFFFKIFSGSIIYILSSTSVYILLYISCLFLLVKTLLVKFFYFNFTRCLIINVM